MNLILDVGNSYTKISLFKDSEISHLLCFKSDKHEDILKSVIQLSDKYLINKAILSSVGSEFIEFEKFLSQKFQTFVKLNHHTKIPVKNLYKTPETLGKDRIAAVVAASNIFPETDVLVFDAGTALTVDFINKNKEYRGGSISPGIFMRYKALHYFTDKLPELSLNQDFDAFFGANTNDSITSGVQYGILKEVEGYIKKYAEQYAEMKIIFTGGDMIFFEKRLKNKIFADPNIVAKGLNIILKYNAK